MAIRYVYGGSEELVQLPDGSPFLRGTWMFCRDTSLELAPVLAFAEYLQQYYQKNKD